jgi:hypothetical protein
MRKLIFFTLFLCLAAPALAEVAIETSVSRSVIPVGEQLTLDIIVSNAEGRIEAPEISSIEGFTSYSQGRSQEFTIINGQSSSRSIFTYVLVAHSTGPKTIGPILMTIGGRQYKVAPVKVEVTQSGQAPSPYSWSQTPVTTPSPRALPPRSAQSGDQDIFVKAWIDKDEVYVNEPVMLTYTLFTKLSATYKGFEKEPETTGFWVEDFPPEKTVKRTEQYLNGQRYVVADVRKLALFATQAGVFTVDPGTLSANVEMRSGDNFDTFFSGNIFGGRRYSFPNSYMSQVVNRTLATEPVKINAKALPETGKPASFSGAVGQYQISSGLDKREVQAGDPVTLRIRISGRGNINTLQSPVIPANEAFKVYDSSSSIDISKEKLIVEGEKVTETVIVPRRAGKYTIPALAFSYFDPDKGQYVELKTGPHELNVTKGEEEELPPAPSSGIESVAQENVGLSSQDIRFIKTADNGKRLPAMPLYAKPVYWAVNGLLLLACLCLGALASRLPKASDAKGMRLRRSHSVARSKLRAAAQRLKEDDTKSFYDEVAKAVYGYFADKLDIPVQSVSLERIQERTPEADAAFLNKLRKLFDELGHGRFASAQKGHDQMQAVYDEADEVITDYEKVKKR